MFEAASYKFVRNVGRESGLLAVPDLNSAVRCKTLGLVEKKQHKWFWRSPAYTPIPNYTLNDILQVHDQQVLLEEVVSTQTRLLTSDYHRQHEHSINGHIGASLKTLLEVEAKGSDSITVESNLGDIEKLEVNQRELVNTLQSRKINLDNEYVKQLCQLPRRVLCVITGVAVLKNEGVVTVHTTWKAEEEFKAGKEPVLGNEDGSVSADTTRSMKIPATTPVAYEVHELEVKPDGSIRLLLGSDHRGSLPQSGTVTADVVDGDICREDETEAFLLTAMKDVDEEKRHALRKSVIEMTSSPGDIQIMLRLLRGCNSGEGTPHGEHDAIHNTVTSITKEFHSEPDSWTTILQFANFQFKVPDDVVIYPAKTNTQLSSMVYLFEALSELDEETCLLLQHLTIEDAESVYVMVSKALQKEDGLWETGVYSQKGCVAARFADSIGFSARDNTVNLPLNNFGELQGVCRTIAALWPKCILENSDEAKWCSLL